MEPRKNRRCDQGANMKREDLKTLDLPDETIDAIMKLHGKDVEIHKSQLMEAEKQAGALQGLTT
jgi:hypothetical protein